MQKRHQLLEGRGIEPSVFLKAVARPSAELIEVPAGLGHSDHRYIEVPSLHHRLQRRKNLLVRQVSGGAEKNQGAGLNLFHYCFLLEIVSRSSFPDGRQIRSASPT